MEYKNVFPKSTTTGSPAPGHLMLFQYGAKTANKLRYYDRNPLCYITASQGNIFWGVNLHYYAPDEREGVEVTYLEPNDGGVISPEAVKEVLKENTVLVSIMHVNNELGTINDIADLQRGKNGKLNCCQRVRAIKEDTN